MSVIVNVIIIQIFAISVRRGPQSFNVQYKTRTNNQQQQHVGVPQGFPRRPPKGSPGVPQGSPRPPPLPPSRGIPKVSPGSPQGSPRAAPEGPPGVQGVSQGPPRSPPGVPPRVPPGSKGSSKVPPGVPRGSPKDSSGPFSDEKYGKREPKERQKSANI